MAKSVTTYEKPTPHINLADWFAKQWQLQKTSETRRNDAFELRNSGRQIRSETRIKTQWDTYMNNTRLGDRLTELSKWRERSEAQLERLNQEIQLLKEERVNTEKKLENLNLPLQVIAECVSMRDCRRGVELTYDEADTELRKELGVVEGVKKLLTDRVQAAWKKLNHFEEVKFQVELNLQDKIETIAIDQENFNLDRNCASISLNPNALRTPKNISSYESWLDHCRESKLLADNEMSDAYNFREALRVLRVSASNDIKAQQDVTDFTLRKRIYQTQKARNELEWHKMKMQKEMNVMLKEIAGLEDAFFEKTDAIKCAETRLENRMYRPGFELCSDEVEIGLQDEVLQLRQTRENLLDKINCAKATYNGLESLLIQVDKNLDDKQHSLMTDVMCLDLRAYLKTFDRAAFPNEINHNILLTRMEEEISPEP